MTATLIRGDIIFLLAAHGAPDYLRLPLKHMPLKPAIETEPAAKVVQ
jgi:hypothetical protein